MRKWFSHLLVLLSLTTFGAAPAFAYEYEEEEIGLNYDALLKRLSKSDEVSQDPFEDVKIHTGLGLSNSVYSISHPNGDKTFAAQRGVQISLGIDLFSKSWMAEGSFRNYGESTFENAKVELTEFDLKLVYKTLLNPTWGVQGFGGIVARYLDVDYFGDAGAYKKSYQTPASVFGGGLQMYLSSKWSVGADGSIKSAMIAESPDRTAFDFLVRLDGHF